LTLAKTLFIITVSTARLIFPGMPGMPGAPEAAKPPAVRSMSIEVASNTAAATSAKASVAVPEGLKAGSTLDLQIDPTAAVAAKPETAKNTVMEYWGSGQVIGADQPKVTKPGSAPPDDAAASMPDKSYAYWPRQDSKPLDESAAVLGTYTLKTSYCGGTSVTLAKEQSFLDPVNITNAESEPNLDKPIVVRWKPVANAMGYVLKAYGGDDKKSITWTSSAKPELAQGIEYRPVGKDDVENYLKLGVLIPPYVASSTIPAGVFKGSTSVMLIMTAVGKDVVQTKDGIETRVLVRSTGSIPLHSAPIGPPRVPKNAHRDDNDSE
jgi:hypothetical protein